jgi:hypothetical protein
MTITPKISDFEKSPKVVNLIIPLTSDLAGMGEFVDSAQALLRRGQRQRDLSEAEFMWLAGLWSKLQTPLTQYAARCFAAQDNGKKPDADVLALYKKLSSFVAEVGLLYRELERNGQWNELVTRIAERGAHHVTETQQ